MGPYQYKPDAQASAYVPGLSHSLAHRACIGKNHSGARLKGLMLKKRLRKKLRLKEFREVCFEIAFQIDPNLASLQVDSLTDAFIDMIEENNLLFGGGGCLSWNGIVQGPCRGSTSETDRELVLRWLRQQPSIHNASAGPLRDAWYGWSR